MNECNCSLDEKSSGEGCRVCNPQEMIDLLLEHIAELEQCISKLEAKNIMKQSSNDIYAIQVNDLLQRIAELEAPKNCEGCKYYEAEDLYMGYCIEISTDVNNKWGCLSYKPKEQK